MVTDIVAHRRTKPRILMANEPRSYREAIATAIRRLRPQVEVVVAEPEELDTSVERLRPDVVVCSRVTERVRSRVPVWIELYGGSGEQTVVSVGGVRSTVNGVQLSDLLSLVDRAGSV